MVEKTWQNMAGNGKTVIAVVAETGKKLVKMVSTAGVGKSDACAAEARCCI